MRKTYIAVLGLMFSATAAHADGLGLSTTVNSTLSAAASLLSLSGNAGATVAGGLDIALPTAGLGAIAGLGAEAASGISSSGLNLGSALAATGGATGGVSLPGLGGVVNTLLAADVTSQVAAQLSGAGGTGIAGGLIGNLAAGTQLLSGISGQPTAGVTSMIAAPVSGVTEVGTATVEPASPMAISVALAADAGTDVAVGGSSAQASAGIGVSLGIGH